MGQEKHRARSARPLGSRVGKRHEYQDQNADHGAPNGHLDEGCKGLFLRADIHAAWFVFAHSVRLPRTKPNGP